MVLRALELLGKRIVRADRSRHGRMNGRPWHEAHILWAPDRQMLDRALASAWDLAPWAVQEHGCCGVTVTELTATLDRYVRDLCRAQQGHTVTDLRYRLAAYVGVET